jgi:integrase
MSGLNRDRQLQALFDDITPFSTKVIRMPEGDRFVLTVNAEGFPVDWPNLYCSIELRSSGIALNTMQTHMTAVSLLHNWAAERGVDLRQRIETLDLLATDEIDSLRLDMRLHLTPSKTGSKVVKNPHWGMRLRAIAAYVHWHADIVISRMSARDERWAPARKRLAAACKRIVGKIRIRKSKKKGGLKKEAQRALAKAITIGHPTNPFARRTQPRNLALVVIYSEGGLRRGEALGLKCIDMHLNGPAPYVVVERRPDDEDDTRSDQPQAKTLPHPVPISPRAARIIAEYMIYDRPTYEAADTSPYVFISQENRPLSTSSVDQIFRKLRAVDGIPADFSPQALRRTWNDRAGDAAEELGIPPELEMQIRNEAQGRVRHSSQAIDYQVGRLRRRGNDVAIVMQNKATEEPAND